ncbi:MAG TPA: acyl-CoA dehydrogenase family protein [Mycobacteriales bacterium]|nr:acyl-CoA dehydrogenase family protein [Mycobacteriales bacterium]
MSDDLLDQAADELFSQVVTPGALADAERDGWSQSMWAALSEMGLPGISVPEDRGGQGGSVADALGVLRIAGWHALPLPLAETGLLAGWLLSSSGLSMPATPLTAVAPRDGDDLSWDGSTVSGTLRGVPWAQRCSHVVALLDGVVVQLDRDELMITAATNLAGEPRGSIVCDHVTPAVWAAAGPGVDIESLRLRGALTRVCLMAGALERVLDLTVRYTDERRQFGRPIARFQAVQAHLVHIAQQAAIASMAADIASREYERGSAPLEVWAAKTVCGEAARIATRAAHQAHGAMGMTQEYVLHHLTRRLWSWTREYEDAGWAWRLGSAVIERGADELYPLITAGSALRR